jgi:hypothetical protein
MQSDGLADETPHCTMTFTTLGAWVYREDFRGFEGFEGFAIPLGTRELMNEWWVPRRAWRTMGVQGFE